MPPPFVALLVNTRESACRIIHLQSGLNSWLVTVFKVFLALLKVREKR